MGESGSARQATEPPLTTARSFAFPARRGSPSRYPPRSRHRCGRDQAIAGWRTRFRTGTASHGAGSGLAAARYLLAAIGTPTFPSSAPLMASWHLPVSGAPGRARPSGSTTSCNAVLHWGWPPAGGGPHQASRRVKGHLREAARHWHCAGAIRQGRQPQWEKLREDPGGRRRSCGGSKPAQESAGGPSAPRGRELGGHHSKFRSTKH